MPVRKPITTWRQFISSQPVLGRLRTVVRDGTVLALSTARTPPPGDWIRFPFYHYVFDDERRSFRAQLAYMANLGDFLSLDAAVDYLSMQSPPRGRYFCITFDDGYKNCMSNAAPILLDLHVPAAFFIPTDFIGVSPDDERTAIIAHHLSTPIIEFLDWNDCRSLVRAGMTVGSHTASHARLLHLSEEQVERELRLSKERIEGELCTSCHHFAPPFGRPGIDFKFPREPELASRLGYRSFLTGERGTHTARPSPMLLHRDHMMARWGTYQLKYFFSH